MGRISNKDKFKERYNEWHDRKYLETRTDKMCHDDVFEKMNYHFQESIYKGDLTKDDYRLIGNYFSDGLYKYYKWYNEIYVTSQKFNALKEDHNKLVDKYNALLKLANEYVDEEKHCNYTIPSERLPF